MKKVLATAIAIVATASAWAGGLVTNTNQSIAFDRMFARGATSEIDAVFSNPAGTAFNEHEGFTLSLNIQSAFQTRNVLSTFEAPFLAPDAQTKKYEGKATAPFIPSVYAMYKKNNWVFQGGFAIVGGGGKCSYNNGLPMFDDAIMTGIYAKTAAAGMPIIPSMYDLGSSMKGTQYIFGLQLGASYKFNEHFSGHLGLRVNYYSGKYEGYAKAIMGETPLASIDLDCRQKGWGVTPIVGLNYKVGPLTLAAKYEFKTKITIKNDTKKLDCAPADFESALADYKDGVKTPNDIPAILYVAAGYEILPKKLRAAVEYHFYDDKNACMAHDKQKLLKRGTNEFLAGVEWDITRMFTVSAGGQVTRYGLTDDYQSQTAFTCNSYSIGFGGAINITPKLKLNLAYFWTTYSDYTKVCAAQAAGGPGYCGTPFAGTDVYSRTNKVVGIGLDYKF